MVGEEGGNAGGCVGVVVLMHLLLGPLLVVVPWPPSSPPRSCYTLAPRQAGQGELINNLSMEKKKKKK